MNNYIDTHFHLDLFKNPQEIAEAIEREKIYTIAVTNTPSVFFFTNELAQGKRYLRASLGMHPELALERENELPQMLTLIPETRYIGEIGLDYKNLNDQEKKRQRKIFERILNKCAEYGDKILSLHSRGCARDVIDMVGPKFPGSAILHWFSGTNSELELALENGFYFSINQRMTSTKNGREIISNIPPDRMLVESDGPFVQIEKQKGTPMLIPKTYDAISKVCEVSPQSIRNTVYNNFKNLLTPKGPGRIT